VGDVVADGVLLPADRGPLGQLEGVVLDDGAGVGGRAEPDGMGAKRRRDGVGVDAPVLEKDAQGIVLSAANSLFARSSPE